MGKSREMNPMISHPVNKPGIRDPRTVLARDQIPNYESERPDPEIPDLARPDNTLCTECGAVYQNQHWVLDEKKRQLLIASGAANEVICPGCKIVAERNPQGIVYLSGDYWPAHREEILNLIRNEEARGMSTNPLERIIDIRDEDNTLIIETTNEKLAQKIGRSINKAHSGDLEYKWSGGNHLVRIYWERSLETGNGKKG